MKCRKLLILVAFKNTAIFLEGNFRAFIKNIECIHFNSEIPLLGLYPKEIRIWQEFTTRMFFAALFIIATS